MDERYRTSETNMFLFEFRIKGFWGPKALQWGGMIRRGFFILQILLIQYGTWLLINGVKDITYTNSCYVSAHKLNFFDVAATFHMRYEISPYEICYTVKHLMGIDYETSCAKV